MFDPARAAMDVFPSFREDTYELEESVGNAWDESYFDNISIIEFFPKSDFGGLLGVGSGFRAADSTGEDDCVVDEWISFPS